MGGQLFYLAAATYGVAPLGVYALVCLVRREGVRSERGAIALAALAAAAGMLLVAGIYWHAPFRSDQMIYGRYNEATLVPILVAGVVALVTVPLDRRRIVVMLAPIARALDDPVHRVGRRAARHRARQLQHPRRRAGGRPRPRCPAGRDRRGARPGGGRADSGGAPATARSRWWACCASWRCSVSEPRRACSGPGSRDRANEQLIAAKLVQIESVVPPARPVRRLRPSHRGRVRGLELSLPHRRLAVRAARRAGVRGPVSDPDAGRAGARRRSRARGSSPASSTAPR